jgi:hypothetical protein
MAKRAKTIFRATGFSNAVDTGISNYSLGSEQSERSMIRIGQDLSITVAKHNNLLNALMMMLAPHIRTRKAMLLRYDKISRDLAGYLKNDGVDKTHQKLYESGETNVIPDQRYPMAEGHVDDIVTHLMQILFPARAMYGATQTKPAEENIAASFISVMNMHAEQFGHYTQYGRMLHDAIAFNESGLTVEWRKVLGYLNNRNNAAGEAGVTDIIYSGNYVQQCDLYNSIWDYTCEPDMYPSDAEFYAMVETANIYKLRKMVLSNEIFGPESMLKSLRTFDYSSGHPVLQTEGMFYNNYSSMFGIDNYSSNRASLGLYHRRPQIRSRFYSKTANSDIGSIFQLNTYANGQSTSEADEASMIQPNEILNIKARIVPSDYGLSDINELQIWNFKIVNGAHIVLAEQDSIAHGLLPVTRIVPKRELGVNTTKSVAESLIPFQDQMSSTLNLYTKGMQKTNNNGLIFYDSKAIKLDQMARPSHGYVPVTRDVDTPGAQQQPIGNFIANIHQRPEINTSIQDIAQIKSMMQDVMPTEMIKQLADLNRATTHQSQSYTNAASRKIFKLARDISNSGITAIMHMMTKNVIEYADPMIIQDANGQDQQIDPKSFRDANVQLQASDGLRGIDTVAISQSIGSIIQYVLQSPAANQQLDVVKLIEYQLHTQGATFNIEDFKFKNPFDALDVQQKQIAFQLLQQAVAQQQQNGQQNTQLPAA